MGGGPAFHLATALFHFMTTHICRIAGAPETGMFSRPYFTAGLTIHGLL